MKDKNLKIRKNNPTSNKGITLIALIITIIVMLILVAVTINLAINGGLFDYAKRASEEIKNAMEEESNLGNGEIAIGGQTYSSIDEYISSVSGDVYVAFYANDNTLRFASKREKLPEINTSAGDEYYGNIKNIFYNTYLAVANDESSRCADTPWFSKADVITDIEFVDRIYPTNTQLWFYKLKKVQEIDVANLDVSKDTNLRGLFSECELLKNIENLDTFDTSKVTNMYAMFNNCSALTTLDLSSFKTENVETMDTMFHNCSGLTSLELSSNFKTDNVTNMGSMFYDCSNLTSLDIGHFNTEKVTNMYAMFWRCAKLESLDIANWNTGKVKNMQSMLSRCDSLTLDCSAWNVSNVTNHTSFIYLSPNIIEPNWK